MGNHAVDKKKDYVEGPAGKSDQIITTVVAFHPDLINALSKVDNGKSSGNLPFVVEGPEYKDDGKVVSVALAQDPKVLNTIKTMRETRANATKKGEDRG